MNYLPPTKYATGENILPVKFSLSMVATIMVVTITTNSYEIVVIIVIVTVVSNGNSKVVSNSSNSYGSYNNSLLI